MVVGQVVMVMVDAVRNRNDLALDVDRLDVTCEEIDPLEQLADWVDDIRQVQIAGSHFVQHRREQEKVFAVDERDLHVRVACEGLLQFDGHVQTAETTAENQDARAVAHNCSFSMAATSQNTLITPSRCESFWNSCS